MNTPTAKQVDYFMAQHRAQVKETNELHRTRLALTAARALIDDLLENGGTIDRELWRAYLYALKELE